MGADMTPSEASKSASLHISRQWLAKVSVPSDASKSTSALGNQPEVTPVDSCGVCAADVDSCAMQSIPQAPYDTVTGPALSVGSRLHSSGECKPCSWFWKPQGCRDGAECKHCHICPAERKRKSSKLKPKANAQANVTAPVTNSDPVPEASLDALPNVSCAVTEQAPSEGLAGAALDLPSVGSALHGTGACKPCSFFWKPIGCQSKSECLHCHLCGPDEQAKRKKAKIDAMRSRPNRASGSARR